MSHLFEPHWTHWRGGLLLVWIMVFQNNTTPHYDESITGLFNNEKKTPKVMPPFNTTKKKPLSLPGLNLLVPFFRCRHSSNRNDTPRVKHHSNSPHYVRERCGIVAPPPLKIPGKIGANIEKRVARASSITAAKDGIAGQAVMRENSFLL